MYDNRAEAFTRARASRKMAGWGLGLSLLLCVPFAPLVGLGLGIAVLVRARDGQDHGKGMAIAAIVIGGLYLLASVVLVVVAVVQGIREGVDETERDTSGEIVDGGQVMPAKLRPGDCFNESRLDDLGVDEEIESHLVEAVPCDEIHDGEVFHTLTIPGDDYPGRQAINESSNECFPEFKRFVGKAYARSELELVYFFPTERSWEILGDNGITCVVIDPIAGQVTGSLEDSRR